MGLCDPCHCLGRNRLFNSRGIVVAVGYVVYCLRIEVIVLGFDGVAVVEVAVAKPFMVAAGVVVNCKL